MFVITRVEYPLRVNGSAAPLPDALYHTFEGYQLVNAFH